MQQLQLKAATTATDQGTFTAVISTSTVDREKDVVNPAGMVRALKKWGDTGKKIPLAWNHSTSPDLQIGYIDPHSAKQLGDGVEVTGWIDQSIDAGAHAWRLVKMGTLGFSFGYLILQGSKRKGGGRNIDELDVFEATATPTPMNNDTRIVGYKAMSQMMSMDNPEDVLACIIMMAQAYVSNAPDPEDATEMRSIIADLQELVADVDDAADQAEDATGKALPQAVSQDDLEATTQTHMMDADKPVDETTKETKSRVVDPLRAKADAVELEFMSDGESLRKPPARKEAPKPQPLLTLEELKQRTRDETLIALSGVDDI